MTHELETCGEARKTRRRYSGLMVHGAALTGADQAHAWCQLATQVRAAARACPLPAAAQQEMRGSRSGGAKGAVSASAQAMRRRSGVAGRSSRNQSWPAGAAAAAAAAAPAPALAAAPSAAGAAGCDGPAVAPTGCACPASARAP